MKGYRFGVSWIAANDSAGDNDALDPKAAGSLVTSALLADLFEKPTDKVGADIVRERRKQMKAEQGSSAAPRYFAPWRRCQVCREEQPTVDPEKNRCQNCDAEGQEGL